MKKLLLISLFISICASAQSQHGDEFRLYHNPSKQNYYVEIKTLKGNTTTTPFELRREDKVYYTVSVEWITVQPDHVIAKIDRTSDVYVNHKSSDLVVANALAVRTSAALYPMVLKFDVGNSEISKTEYSYRRYDTSSKIIDVINFDEIVERWENVKSDLEKDFYGEGFDRYIDKNNNRFREKATLIFGLNNDYFLNLFFNDMVYTTYSSGGKATGTLHFPYVFNTKAIKNTVSLEKDTNDDGEMYVRLHGSYDDNRNMYDLLSESHYSTSSGDYPKPEASLVGAYFFNQWYNNIEAISFYYTMELRIEKSMIIRIAHFEEYEDPLNEKEKTQHCSGQIYVPLQLFSDTEKDVQRHLNPLMDINDMTRRDRTHEGITIK